MDLSWLGSAISASASTVSSFVNLGATIDTNKTNKAIIAAQNAAATQQTRDNNATALQLAQQAQQQQQNLINYELNAQKLGQQGAVPWLWLIGGVFFLGLLGFIGYKAFK